MTAVALPSSRKVSPVIDAEDEKHVIDILKNICHLVQKHANTLRHGGTAVITKDLNPTWNESFDFEFNYKLSGFVLQVYDYDKMSKVRTKSYFIVVTPMYRILSPTHCSSILFLHVNMHFGNK